jgi:hypothetical protein
MHNIGASIDEATVASTTNSVSECCLRVQSHDGQWLEYRIRVQHHCSHIQYPSFKSRHSGAPDTSKRRSVHESRASGDRNAKNPARSASATVKPRLTSQPLHLCINSASPSAIRSSHIHILTPIITHTTHPNTLLHHVHR